MTFYIFHRHRIWLVDPVDLVCSLYSLWEGFWSSSLTTLPLGLNCGFISTSACGLPSGICSWGCPGGLGSAPVRARCGAAAAWLAGTLAAPSVQGHGRPPPQELCPIRVFFPSLLWLAIRRPLWPSFSIAPPLQALRGLPCLGSFSVVPSIRHTEGPPWLGSYSVDGPIRHSKGQLGGVLL